MLSGGAGARAQGSKVDKMMMVFDMYDVDKSGSISRKEVSSIFPGDDEAFTRQVTDQVPPPPPPARR